MPAKNEYYNNLKRKLLRPERKTLKRIFGPTKDRNCTWIIKIND